MEKSPYNPFKDDSLHITVTKDHPDSLEDRIPFNEVVKHADIVSGHQIPKKINHLPKWYQNPIRILATIYVMTFASFMVYQIIRIIIAMGTGK